MTAHINTEEDRGNSGREAEETRGGRDGEKSLPAIQRHTQDYS